MVCTTISRNQVIEYVLTDMSGDFSTMSWMIDYYVHIANIVIVDFLIQVDD